MLDADGCYLYVNAEAIRNPIRRADLIGKRPSEVVPRTDEEAHLLRARQTWIDTIVRTGERITMVERRIDETSGKVRLFERAGIPLSDENGRVTFVVVHGMDIGERVTHEREQIAARRAAEDMNALKTALVTNMSHEIRTPLTAIIGFADLLADDLPPDMDREPVALIRSSGERLLDMLNDILDSAKLASHSLHLDVRPYDIRELTRSLADHVRPEAEERGLFVTCRVAPSPVRAAVNADALRRTLHHLLVNAIRFTHEGGVKVDVRVEGLWVVLSVSDSGVGIDPAFEPHLFEAFRQESTVSTRPHQGNGLGLSIALGLTELMKGTITVDSTPGVGSTFTLRFPRLPDDS